MPLSCARCDSLFTAGEFAGHDVAFCARCHSANTVRTFPAALIPSGPPLPAEPAAEGEAACFDHPGKRAVAACRQCGRFVCQLCSVALGADILCPSCVAAGSGKAKAANLETSRTLYDSIALIAPLVTLAFWPFTIIAGPATVVFSLMKWSRPISLVRRSRWRFVVAILIGLIETALWAWGLIYLVAALRTGTGAVTGS
jgi:hypothetical protein